MLCGFRNRLFGDFEFYFQFVILINVVPKEGILTSKKSEGQLYLNSARRETEVGWP